MSYKIEDLMDEVGNFIFENGREFTKFQVVGMLESLKLQLLSMDKKKGGKS